MRRAFFLCSPTLRLSSSVKSNLNPTIHNNKFDYIPKFPLVAFPSSNFSFSSSGNDSIIENHDTSNDNEPALRPESQLVDTENSKETAIMDVSERFEHREESRKDCRRTLFNLIEEAGKANKLVKDTLTLHLKEGLKSNPHFMGRLNTKKTGILASNASTFSSSSARPFSSKTSDSISEQSVTKYEPSDAGKISNKELKKKIEKMNEGDDDAAFMTVFLSILQRKLEGNSDELDAELLRDLPDTSRAYNSEDDNSHSDSNSDSDSDFDSDSDSD